MAALTVIACGDDRVVLSPVLDGPPAGSDADPFSDIDQLTLAIAAENSDLNLAFAAAGPGEIPSVTEVPRGNDLVFHLSGLASGVEVAYGRSCPVDVPLPDDAGAPHLYFSRIAKSGEAAMPAEPTRAGGGAFFAASGLAGFAGGRLMNRVEVFDARAGIFRTLDGEVEPRRGGVLIEVGDGRAVLVGGYDDSDTPLETIDVIDLRDTAEPTVETSPGFAVRGHAGVPLFDGTVLLAGGIRDMETEPTALASLIELGADGVLVPPVELASLNVARAGHTMTRLTEDPSSPVLVVGGRGAGGVMAQSTEMYLPQGETFERVDTATLREQRADHVAARLPTGDVVVFGGRGSDGSPVATFEIYDAEQRKFGATSEPMPSGAGLTDVTLTRLPDGRVLLSGGLDIAGNPVAAVFVVHFNELSGEVQISPTDPMDVPRANHAATLLCDGTVLIVGGSDDAHAAERYNPPSKGRR